MKNSPTPYWNFWRTVFAGWLIRYPGFFWRAAKTIIILQVILIFSLILPFIPKDGESEKNIDTVSYIKKIKKY